jgi:hypothetical protein
MARVAPDGYDVLVYLLNDGPGTHVNTGTAGASANLTEYGTPISGAQGLFGNAMYIAGTPVTSSIDGAGGANNVTTGNAISLSGWVFLKRYSSNPLDLFYKQYFLNAWSNPFLTFGFQMVNSNDGQCDLYITQGNGVLQTQLRTPTAYILPLGKWIHLGGTFDGSTMKFYVNGNLITSGSYVGNIDFNSNSARGGWLIGGIEGSSTNQTACAIFQDIRMANVVRPQSYFANIYFNGIYANG